jgi:3-hydroxyisobutyrate dehydrogenase-like beta-hydroxyacid dehydrogenase
VPDKKNVGFIGLGNIGKPMAKHLVAAQFQLYAYDVFHDAVADLVALGAIGAADPSDIAANCLYIGVCVRDDKDVENLLYGDCGLLQLARPGTVIVIHSTVTQAGLLKWAADASAENIHIIDAPITGGATGAEAGTLCYMVGGDEQQLDAIRPMISTSADKIVHAGSLGTGIALKLCNNLITYAEFAAMSEATRLAEACGLSADVLREVGKSNGVINDQMHRMISNRNMLAVKCSEEQMDQYLGPFGRLGRKDLQCAIDTASELDIQLPATEFVRDMIEDVFVNKA